MTRILFPVSSFPGRTPQESGGRLINCYAEPLGPGARNTAVLRRSPGLRSFSDGALATVPLTVTGFRGAMYSAPYVYAAFEDTLVYIDSAGEMIEIGALDGALPVEFARNNQTPIPDLTVLTENGWFAFDTSAVVEIIDADLPSATSLTFQDGFFFLGIADSRVFASGINAVTIGALDFTQAEAKPDTLLRVVSHEQQLFVCGTTSIEVFTNTGNPEAFPFSRVAVISVGLLAKRAITGFEDGFSRGLIWAGSDNSVQMLAGYGATKISTPDVDRAIIALADKTTLEAYSWIAGGHAFTSFSCPSWTWTYDWTIETWHEDMSYELPCSRRVGNAVNAFGKWLCGDSLSGRLLEISDTAFDEVGEPLIMHAESAPIQDFPRGMRVPAAYFDFVSGVGSSYGTQPIETDPSVLVSWSDDGGQSWSSPLVRALGQQATNPRVTVRNTGRTAQQGRRWRVQISDPVYAALLGGELDTISRKAA